MTEEEALTRFRDHLDACDTCKTAVSVAPYYGPSVRVRPCDVGGDLVDQLLRSAVRSGRQQLRS
jgi:hypothetical protein